MEIYAAIEKNRSALLRIVSYWLLAASVFNWSKNKILPPRLGIFLSELIGKVEMAADYLIIAASYATCRKNQLISIGCRAAGDENRLAPAIYFASHHSVTIFALVRRLKIVRQKLSRLEFYAQRRAQRRLLPAIDPIRAQNWSHLFEVPAPACNFDIDNIAIIAPP